MGHLLDFLRYGGLLGDAVLHFFRERMRKNPRVEKTLVQEIFGTLDYAPPEQQGDAQYGQLGPHTQRVSFSS